jgi:hypothetical protein
MVISLGLTSGIDASGRLGLLNLCKKFPSQVRYYTPQNPPDAARFNFQRLKHGGLDRLPKIKKELLVTIINDEYSSEQQRQYALETLCRDMIKQDPATQKITCKALNAFFTNLNVHLETLDQKK